MIKKFLTITTLLVTLVLSTPVAFGADSGRLEDYEEANNPCFVTTESARHLTEEELKSPGAKEYDSYLKNVEAQNKKIEEDNGKNQGQTGYTPKPLLQLPTIKKTVCPKEGGGDVTTYSAATLGAQSTGELPSLFGDFAAGDDPYKHQCTFEDDTLSCIPNNSVLEFRMPVCELFEQLVVSRIADAKKYGEMACTDLLDPLPEQYFSEGMVCIRKQILQHDVGTDSAGQPMSAVSVEFGFHTIAASGGGDNYCNAVLTPTNTLFGGFFAIVRLLYDISLPILIALAVISLVGVGVFIMYAPGGGEETIKKAKTMAIQIFTGFMLLLLLRVFLGLVSADLFGEETAPPTTPNASIVRSMVS